MDIDALRTFVAVADSGSFSSAARQLHLTQPAISKRIAKLESELGTPLLDRIGKQARPTGPGTKLLEHGRQILADIHQAERQVREASQVVVGTLHIATSHHIGLHRLPPFLKTFSDLYPGARLQIAFTDSEKAYTLVQQGQVELAVITLALAPDPGLHTQLLWHDPLVFMAATSHPLAQQRQLSLAQLGQHRCILPGLDTYTGQIVKALFDDEHITLDTSMATNYLETVKMLAQVGMGWTVLPSGMLDAQLVQLQVPQVQLSRQLGTICHRQHTLSTPAKAFMQLLQTS